MDNAVERAERMKWLQVSVYRVAGELSAAQLNGDDAAVVAGLRTMADLNEQLVAEMRAEADAREAEMV